MVLVWSAMFPFSTAISYGLAWLPFSAQWPLAVRTFCLSGMLVPFMVFGALPFINRRFHQWLQMPTPDAGALPTQTVTITPAQSIDQPKTNSRAAFSPYPYLTTNGVEA